MEKRSIQLQSNGNGRTIEGYALIFNVPSDNLNFTEVIHPEAIDDELIANSDVFARYNHDDNIIYARSNHGNGTLHLEKDDKGLRFMFQAPDTQWGNDLVTYIKNGDLNKCSFAFSTPDDGSTYTRQSDGTIRRDIYKIDKLYDVSIVPIPAYESTFVTCRNGEKKDYKKIYSQIREIFGLN